MREPAPIGAPSTDSIPSTVAEAFRGRAYLTMPKFSKASNMAVKTIKRHIDAGNLNWRNVGHGERRIRRGFTLPDVADFYRRIKRGAALCQCTDTATLPSGTSTSSGRVIDFQARRALTSSIQKKKHKPSRKRSVGRPSALLQKLGVPEENH